MTVIAAASWDRETWVGSDRAGTNTWGNQSLYHEKLEHYEWGSVGFAGSFRVLQAIENDLRKLERLSSWPEALRLVEIVESGLERVGWSKPTTGKLPVCEDLWMLFVGAQGGLWIMQPDLSILPCEHYASIGSGAPVARGSLWTSKRAGWGPSTAVENALKAACQHDAACAGPAKPTRVR